MIDAQLVKAWTTLVVAGVLVLGLAGCNETQQPLVRTKGTYRGEPPAKLSAKQIEALRTRGALQSF